MPSEFDEAASSCRKHAFADNHLSLTCWSGPYSLISAPSNALIIKPLIHPCWKVLLRHKPPVDFIVWARMDEANRDVPGIYLLPVAAFPEHTVLWPSTRTLASYACFAYPSIAHLFGVAAAV
jgi:hypothetical protein